MKRGSVNWQELSSTSHYQTAVAIEHELQKGNIREATAGIQELIDALARSEKRALKSQLIRLMTHVIKWKSQPEKQSRSWAATIYNAREEIEDIQEEIPSLTQAVILEMWDKCFRAAKRETEGEINQKSPVSALSWAEVFEDQYEIGES
ncbi:MAG: DUF29 domain-containing protein [Candidatus Tectomicrobia bacterium]|nr:DUF29 domain-containing protein [Candidatus Tectomicrobia bacterium]